MAQTFRIAEVRRLKNFATIGERSTVKESMFWHLLAGKVCGRLGAWRDRGGGDGCDCGGDEVTSRRV